MNRNNRVLIVVQNLPVPFDRRVWLEATTLARHGYRVSVICPKMRGFNAGRETLEDIEIHRYPLPIDAQGKLGFVLEFLWCFLATSLLSLKVQIAGRGFDVLHVCNPPETYWPLAWFWRAFGKRFIFDHHDLSPEMFAVKFERPATREEGGALFKALLFLERMTFRAAQIVITTNESHKRIAVARGGKRPEDVFIVRSGPDLSRFKVYEPDPKWRNGKPFLIAYLGEICKQDGVDHLVRAVKILRDELKRTDVHCIFMGGGPHQKAIADYAVEIGVQELCTFTGRVSDEDLCRVLSTADIGIDPDPKNAWSDQSTMNKVIEYMFFGLPVLSYDLHETWVSAGDAGMFVTANDERALAQGIVDLLDDPARRQRLGAVGHARVRAVLAWNYSVPPLLAAYRAVFGDRTAAVAGPEPASVEAEP
ncbi:glycosyltransferase family 4 protein [Dongia sp.]|uniref:glycosyltransferase family 4 protein n=1 Tax=Dongia sp. TaxID=1977262 RepID=UPI003752B0ED